MITIISSTNRSGAYTRKVAEIYASILLHRGAAFHILDLKDLPPDFIFSATYDNRGKNEGFNAIQALVDATDKFVFIIPEYNGSFPGVLKAFIDGLKFPDSFRNKFGALVGISSGSMGGALAISHMTDILNYLGMFIVPVKPRLAGIEKAFADGVLINEFYLELLKMQINQLLAADLH